MTPFATKIDFYVTGICCVLIKLQFAKVMFFFFLDRRAQWFFQWLEAP